MINTFDLPHRLGTGMINSRCLKSFKVKPSLLFCELRHVWLDHSTSYVGEQLTLSCRASFVCLFTASSSGTMCNNHPHGPVSDLKHWHSPGLLGRSLRCVGFHNTQQSLNCNAFNSQQTNTVPLESSKWIKLRQISRVKRSAGCKDMKEYTNIQDTHTVAWMRLGFFRLDELCMVPVTSLVCYSLKLGFTIF